MSRTTAALELSPVTTYYYRVRACNATGCSSYATANEQTDDAPPAAPSNLAGTAQGVNQSDVTDNSSNEDGFKIEISLNGSTFQLLDITGSNVTSYASTGFQANTRYYYRVRAFNALGDSAYSNTINVRTRPK